MFEVITENGVVLRNERKGSMEVALSLWPYACPHERRKVFTIRSGQKPKGCRTFKDNFQSTLSTAGSYVSPGREGHIHLLPNSQDLVNVSFASQRRYQNQIPEAGVGCYFMMRNH